MHYLKNKSYFRNTQKTSGFCTGLYKHFFLIVNETEDGTMERQCGHPLTPEPFLQKIAIIVASDMCLCQKLNHSHIRETCGHSESRGCPPFPSLGPGESLHISLHLSLEWDRGNLALQLRVLTTLAHHNLPFLDKSSGIQKIGTDLQAVIPQGNLRSNHGNLGSHLLA